MKFLNIKVLKDKNSQIIFISQLVSTICEKMMSIGLIWYLTKTYSISIVPWFLAISFLPHLLMAFFSTKIINKVGAIRIVVMSEFFRGLVLFILFGCIYFFDIKGNLFLISLYLSGFFVGLGSSLFNPAILSLPPKLVAPDKVAGLNALIDSSMSISSILGAVFAIVILNFVDLKTLILINGLSFIWAGVLQLGLQSHVQILSNHPDAAENISISKIGPLYVLKKYPDIARMLFSFLFLNLVFTPILVMIPWYVQKIYLGDSGSLAIIEGAMGIGAFLTGMFLAFTGYQVSKEKRVSMIGSISFLFGISFMMFAYSLFTWHGALALFSIGILSTFLNIQVLTYFQMALKEEEIPAIMTAVNIISAAAVPISFIFSGLIFPYVSIPDFAKISGILILIMAIFIPKFLQGSIWKPV